MISEMERVEYLDIIEEFDDYLDKHYPTVNFNGTSHPYSYMLREMAASEYICYLLKWLAEKPQ